MQKFKDRDKQEAHGYFNLLTTVFESYKSIPFAESAIKFFHRELLKYSEKDELHRGEYKKDENKVAMVSQTGEPIEILFDTTAPWLTPKEMQELVEWTQTAFLEKSAHPLIIIGNFLMLQHGYEYMPYVSQERLKAGITRPTINQVLNKLLQLKWIERISVGRTTRYKKR